MRLCLGIVFAVFACSPDGRELAINSERQPIIGGSKTSAGDFPSVVAVLEPVAGALCTGTLISPTAIITAAHCIDPGEIGRTAEQIQAEEVVLFDTLDTDHASAINKVPVSQVLENPNHPIFTQADVDFGHDDDAILIMATPRTDRLTSPIDLDATPDKIGATTTLVGYGINNVATQMAGTEFYLTGQVVVSCTVATSPTITDAKMICFNEHTGHGQCNGDSGGPAFDANGHVIGVVSFGDMSCTAFGADTRPTQSAAFIRAAVPELAAGNCVMDGVCNLTCASDPDCAPAVTFCGDGVIQAGEQCDAGSYNGMPGSGCSTACVTIPSVCGNGVVEPGEECDDGTMNGAPGDNCSAGCTLINTDPSQGDQSGGGKGCSAADRTGFGVIVVVLGLAVRRRRRRR